MILFQSIVVKLASPGHSGGIVGRVGGLSALKWLSLYPHYIVGVPAQVKDSLRL